MDQTTQQQFEQRMRELDAAGIAALFDAAREYHTKHARGPGGAAVCICGHGCGGSAACRGLAVLRDLFRYGQWGDPTWKERYECIAKAFDR